MHVPEIPTTSNPHTLHKFPTTKNDSSLYSFVLHINVAERGLWYCILNYISRFTLYQLTKALGILVLGISQFWVAWSECLNICRMKKSQSRNNVTSIKHLMTPYLQVTVTAIILCTLASVSFCSPLLSEWKMTKRLCELWKTLLRTISIGFLVTTRHCIIWPSQKVQLNWIEKFKVQYL